MRIATWNVNSIKQRLDSACTWLAERKPDIVCLQETKCVDDAFPRQAFEALGYNVAIHGQKTFNGVAILSKLPFDEVTPGLPGDDTRRSRPLHRSRGLDRAGRAARRQHLSAQRQSAGHGEIHLQARLDEAAVGLRPRAAGAGGAAGSRPAITMSFRPPPMRAIPQAWINDALFLPQTRAEFRALINLGLTDAVRADQRRCPAFTPSGTIRPAPGRRTTASGSTTCCCRRAAADRLVAAGIDRHVRTWEKPSDHVPVWIDLRSGGEISWRPAYRLIPAALEPVARDRPAPWRARRRWRGGRRCRRAA